MTHSFPTRRSAVRGAEGMKRQFAILPVIAGLLPVVCAGPPAVAAEIRGLASARSGNALVIGDRTLLLFGATAPEVKARSEEHTSELQSLMRISYAVFCLKKQHIHHRILDYH